MIKWVLLLLLPHHVLSSWSSEELAMYDLVEDLNQNFYEYLGISKDASTAEIKKAYRKLSLDLHPDRNKAEDAATQFRQVVAVYEILKSAELREKYDNVLEFGLPDWRQPIFYYRKMRKFTWYESLMILLFISTICHYLMMWAAYYEKVLVVRNHKKKPASKKKKEVVSAGDVEFEDYLSQFKPQIMGLLPFLIVKGSYSLGMLAIQSAIEMTQNKPEPEEEEPLPEKPQRNEAPREIFHYEMATDIKAVPSYDPKMEEKYKKEAEELTIKKPGAQWSFDELSNLIRLTTEKYPPGTPNRWDQIAAALNRTPDDVTAMVGKMKNIKQEEYSKLLIGQQSAAVTNSSSSTVVEPEKVQKSDDEWSQAQQRALETALQRYPKGTEERWDRIAEAVPGKSKEQCVARFKVLAEIIRRRKAT